MHATAIILKWPRLDIQKGHTEIWSQTKKQKTNKESNYEKVNIICNYDCINFIIS